MAFNYRKAVTYRLSRVIKAQRSRSAGSLSKLGLHPGQEQILKTLADLDGQTMGQLAATLSVRPPTVTKMVARLGAQGFVERRLAKNDARQARVYLTDMGQDCISDLDKLWKQLESEALHGIDDKDRKRLSKLLRVIEKNLIN